VNYAVEVGSGATDIHTTFHKDLFGHSIVRYGEFTYTQIAW
jgi:hypothetical protein